MEKKYIIKDVIDKLEAGLQFGFFDDGNKVYFEDGVNIKYADLWLALRSIHKLEHHHKTLYDLCPENFISAFSYQFSRHKWEHKAK